MQLCMTGVFNGCRELLAGAGQCDGISSNAAIVTGSEGAVIWGS